MAVTRAELVNLYLAYFGRPPDIDGLNYYTTNAAATMATVAAGFSASPESQALYGTTFGDAQINAIYQNLFNRDAEPAGLTYWSAEVNAGRITPAGAALAILQGAQNLDAVSVANKVLLSDSFLTQLDTPTEMAGYAGTNAAAAARTFLHTVDSSAASLAIATANLAEQVALATGALPFAVTKDVSNVVSFAHAGASIAVTESGGTFTFTSSGGNAGSGTATGTISGISVPAGTTLTISSTLAGSKAFTGTGTTLVIASATGEDLATILTATGVDAIQLTSGQNYTLTTAQAAMAKIGAAGALGTITDAGTMIVKGTLADVSATTGALKAAGADIVVGTVATGANIYSTSIVGVDRIELAAGQSYEMSVAQAAIVTAAPGTQTVTVLNSAVGGLTLAAEVENFILSNFSNNVTMGAVGQVITGGSGADKVTAIDGVTSTSDLKAGSNIVYVTDGADVSGGTFSATGGTVAYNIDAAATGTLNLAQLALVTSAAGTQNITLSQAASGLTLNSAIETVTLGDFTNSVTMSTVTQVVVGGTGADTVTAITGVTSSSDLKAGANVVVVTNGANLSAGTFSATGGTLGFNVAAAATATLNAAQAAAISSGAGTQNITLSNAATSLALHSSVETFTLGNFTNSVTLGASGQNVTGGTGVDTVTISGTVASGTLDGGGGTADKLVAGGTVGAATISNFEILNVTTTSNISAANGGAGLGATTLTMVASKGLSMTIAQNDDLSSSATVAGTGQFVTLTDAGTTTTIAGIETYNLAAGASTLTLGSTGQTVNANALADGDLLALAGGYSATVTLVTGDLDATAAGGNITVTATTGTNVIETGSGNDNISAGTGDDTIDAGAGADTVTGAAGSDDITLGAGSDVLVFSSLTGADTITDYDVATDVVHLSKGVLTGLGALGALGASAFESGAGLTAAATAAGRIVYDQTTGDLYYDVDGTGGTAAVLVATFTGTPALVSGEFVIIA
jgi:Ca2+-binding RTX toxin-like protein